MYLGLRSHNTAGCINDSVRRNPRLSSIYLDIDLLMPHVNVRGVNLHRGIRVLSAPVLK